VGGGTDGAGLSCVADYPDDVLSWMVYGPFSLSDAIAAELTFQLWLNAERDYDLFYYMASIDGEEFYGPPGLSGSTDEWTAVTLDLTAVPELGNLAGQPEVWIAFVFASDFAVHYSDGAHVDDVLVRKWVGAAETPTATATPSATPTTIHFGVYLPVVKRRTPVPTLGATPTTPATGCPQSGTWTGKTDQGYPVSLLVSDGPLCRVESLTLTLICPTFLWRATTGTAAITNNHFEASAYDRFLDVHLSVVGDFHSPTEVSGSWYSSSTCLGTWEASYTP
jgi:hypothetical protein